MTFNAIVMIRKWMQNSETFNENIKISKYKTSVINKSLHLNSLRSSLNPVFFT